MEFVIVSLHPHLKPDGYYKGKAIRERGFLYSVQTEAALPSISPM